MLTYNTNSKTGPVCGGRAVSYSLFLAVCTTTNLTLGTTLGGQAKIPSTNEGIFVFT